MANPATNKKRSKKSRKLIDEHDVKQTPEQMAKKSGHNQEREQE
jgi:hypothetical protein